MDADFILSQLDEEDRKEVDMILSKAKDVVRKLAWYEWLYTIREETICGIASNYKLTYAIVYAFTYLCLVVFAYDPFTSFFGSLFVKLIIAIPYSLIPMISMAGIVFSTKPLLIFFERRIRSWEDTRHIFHDYLERKEIEFSFGEATGDFFDYEMERQAMELFRKKNKNFHAPSLK